MLPRAVDASIRVRQRGHGCKGETVTVMQSFELQVYKGGKWEFDSYFDDRETALFEATRLHEYNRYNGIRVLEEIFRDNSDTSDCTVIFSRLRKVENQGGGGAGAPRTQAARETNRMAARETNKSGQEQKGGSGKSSKTKSRKTGKARPAAKSRQSSKSKSNASLKMLLIMAAIILIIGVGAMVGLRYMASSL